jgi:hypothetical protein
MTNYLQSRPRALIGLAVVTGACAVAAALPTAASASAYGCTASGAGLPWYGLNSSYTCIDVGGSGDTVWLVSGNWMGAGTICNYRWAIRFSDASGRVYETDVSPLHVGCSGGAAKWTMNYGSPEGGGWYSGVRKWTGRVCMYLYESGSQRNGVPCESIHP